MQKTNRVATPNAYRIKCDPKVAPKKGEKVVGRAKGPSLEDIQRELEVTRYEACGNIFVEDTEAACVYRGRHVVDKVEILVEKQ